MNPAQFVVITISAVLVSSYLCRMGSFRFTWATALRGAGHYLGFGTALVSGFNAWQYGAAPIHAVALLASATWLVSTYGQPDDRPVTHIKQSDP